MKKLAILAAASALALPAAAQAAFLPFGIQQNVDISTVTGAWGWSQLYRGNYGDVVPVATAFAGAGTYVMIGAIQDGTTNLTLLAGTSLADFQTVTGVNATHLSNGAEWYYNNLSMGFAPAGSVISQNSADTKCSPGFDPSCTGELRMSWHASGAGAFGSAPTSINGGWRVGDITFLNAEPTGWDRVIFTANSLDNGAVPEPATWAMMLAGFGLMGASLRRRQAVRVRYAI